MPAYLISRIRITDEERFAKYRAASIPVAQKFGAEYLARSDKVEALDGSYDGRRLVIIKFPDTKTARAFWASPEYRAAREHRLGAAEIDIWLVPEA
ncbi:MAG: DUF1330 domain-containing protein [Alphaproteobacteria bacterium]